jgi:hypothetical protein
MPHDLVKPWKEMNKLREDRDSWRRLAEGREQLSIQNAKVIKGLNDRIWRLKEQKKANSKRRPSTEYVQRLRSELSEARKQLKRMRRITHCKQCRCMDNPRKEYFAERYEAKKAARSAEDEVGG